MNLDHVEGWNAFRDADYELDTSIGSFQTGVGRKRWRNENHRRVSAGLLTCYGDSVEDRQSLVRGSAFARCDASHNDGPVSLALQGMKCTLTARDALHDQSRILVNEDAQGKLPFVVSCQL